MYMTIIFQISSLKHYAKRYSFGRGTEIKMVLVMITKMTLVDFLLLFQCYIHVYDNYYFLFIRLANQSQISCGNGDIDSYKMILVT